MKFAPFSTMPAWGPISIIKKLCKEFYYLVHSILFKNLVDRTSPAKDFLMFKASGEAKNYPAISPQVNDEWFDAKLLRQNLHVNI